MGSKAFRLSEEDLSSIGAIEEELDNEKALAIYWRYVGAKMGFDARTVATTGEGEFSAIPSVPSVAIAREWSEDIGGGMTADVIELSDGSLICNSPGLLGVYESDEHFDGAEALVCVVV